MGTVLQEPMLSNGNASTATDHFAVPAPQKQGTAISAAVLVFAAIKLLVHLLTASRYGIFRDELYYFARSQHVAWGYVDQPPLVPFLLWIVRHILGDSIFALRVAPALAGAALVWLTALLAKEMGGGKFAQCFAALAIIPVPIYLVMHHWITVNAFEPLVWTGCVWFVVRAINSGNPRNWFWFGLLAGVGFEVKYSIAFFLIGVLVGVIATQERRFLKSRRVWLGALAAFFIFLPNFIWLVRHDFPFLELMHNLRMHSPTVARNPLSFFADQIVVMNPLLFPLWGGGLWWLFFGRTGKRYRVLGWTYLVILAAFTFLHGKNYYVAPIYPMLLAAGAVALELATQTRWRRARIVYGTVIVITAAIFAPIFAPLLPVQTYIRYQKWLGFEPPKTETQDSGLLPQYFADEFGWEDMVREVARIYHSLPPEEQAKTAVFANNYGEAGAIDYFGPKYGLPQAVSGHQNYWYWGPRNYTGEIVIVLGSDGSGDRDHFQSVQVAGHTTNPLSRTDERYDIYLCRGLKGKLEDVWPMVKRWN